MIFFGVLKTMGQNVLGCQHCLLYNLLGLKKKNQYFLGHMACVILAPRAGIEPVPLALEARSLNQWTAREVPAFKCSAGIESNQVRPQESKKQYKIIGVQI